MQKDNIITINSIKQQTALTALIPDTVLSLDRKFTRDTAQTERQWEAREYVFMLAEGIINSLQQVIYFPSGFHLTFMTKPWQMLAKSFLDAGKKKGYG